MQNMFDDSQKTGPTRICWPKKKTLFLGESIGFDFHGLTRCEIFDQRGRWYDVPVCRSAGKTLREACSADFSRNVRSALPIEYLDGPAKVWLEKIENFYNTPLKFCIDPTDKGDEFYEKEIGALSDRQIRLGIPRKQIFDITELFLRERARIEKLALHLKRYGGDIFEGYVRESWPNKFVRPLVEHLYKVAREAQVAKGQKVEFVENLTRECCPSRESGIQKMAADGDGLSICEEHRNFFSDERLKSYQDYWSDFCTNERVYDQRPDTVEDAAREIAAIAMTVRRFKDKTWPIALDLLFNEGEPEGSNYFWIANYPFFMACRHYMDDGDFGRCRDNFC